MNDKVKFKVNSQAVVKTAGLLSNSVIFTANAWLIGNNVYRQFKERKAEQIAERMQFTAQVASAIAGVARVIVNAVERR
jgi:hypothetical protein